MKRVCVLLAIVVGNAVFAFAVAGFVIPSHLICGGSTGLALVAEHWWGVPVDWFLAVFNILMFFLGLFCLGRAFAMTTLLSSLLYPLFLSLFQRIPALARLTDNPLLASLYAGVLIGVGIGLVLREGASTGGMDIPPIVINRRTGIPVSHLLYACDTVLLLAQVAFSDVEEVLYGLIVVFLTSFVLNKVMVAGKRQVQVTIVSPKSEELNRLIQRDLDRGSTLLRGVTGHLGREQMVIFTVISPRELPKLNSLVLGVDPKAFLVVAHVSEVRGRGFTLAKHDPAVP